MLVHTFLTDHRLKCMPNCGDWILYITHGQRKDRLSPCQQINCFMSIVFGISVIWFAKVANLINMRWAKDAFVKRDSSIEWVFYLFLTHRSRCASCRCEPFSIHFSIGCLFRIESLRSVLPSSESISNCYYHSVLCNSTVGYEQRKTYDSLCFV